MVTMAMAYSKGAVNLQVSYFTEVIQLWFKRHCRFNEKSKQQWRIPTAGHFKNGAGISGLEGEDGMEDTLERQT